MLARTAFSTLLAAALALASPTPNFETRQDGFSVKVTNFKAFHADPYFEGAQSNLTFTVTDTRPEFFAKAECIIPNTYFNLFAISALFDYCGDRKLDISYRYTEQSVLVRRGWQANETTYLRGSATQISNFKEGVNITKFQEGKLLHREEDWVFPLTVQVSTPP